MEVILRRHAMTAGNARRAYVGATDEPLSPQGHQLALHCGSGPDTSVEKIYCSPLLRAVESGRIFYPNAQQVLCHGLAEMDFGDFEGKNYEDLAGNPAYQEWLDSNCQDACPGGESLGSFSQRVCRAFTQLLEEARQKGESRVVLVAHGGTLMSIMAQYALPQRGYFDWQTPNCGGYWAKWDGHNLVDWRSLTEGERA